ncbi:hypothetical protein TNCV_1135281 [Trichonephila clavipes]|nr:hypothetical protein TNCV_1135281 [Trichonephila clavipes]
MRKTVMFIEQKQRYTNRKTEKIKETNFFTSKSVIISLVLTTAFVFYAIPRRSPTKQRTSAFFDREKSQWVKRGRQRCSTQLQKWNVHWSINDGWLHLAKQTNESLINCQVIYSQFGLAIHQNDHQARRRFVEWAQNEIAVVPDFHKRILFSDEAHFWLNGYVNKQNGRIWSEANPQVYVETPLHPEKLTVWCALWAGGILLQKR